jgi:hypothetical protein
MGIILLQSFSAEFADKSASKSAKMLILGEEEQRFISNFTYLMD